MVPYPTYARSAGTNRRMSNGPSADKPWFPYRGHRTMAEVLEDEEKQREKRRRYYRSNYKSLKR